MKKIIGLALVAGCLAAMPVMAQAAEFPAVDIATKCEYANGHTGFKKDDRPDEITMKKLILTETEADGFTASAKFVFTAEGKMQFAEKENGCGKRLRKGGMLRRGRQADCADSCGG